MIEYLLQIEEFLGGHYMRREQIKALIELSNSFEEANEVIETYTPNKSYAQKIAYLQGMFDCEIVGRHIDSEEADYMALLTSIIDRKWK